MVLFFGQLLKTAAISFIAFLNYARAKISAITNQQPTLEYRLTLIYHSCPADRKGAPEGASAPTPRANLN